MARKHRKQGIVKTAVQTSIITATNTDRKVIQNPTTGEFEVITSVTPAVVKQGKALSSTIVGRGKPNTVPVKGGKR